jgi:hypothetical protein
MCISELSDFPTRWQRYDQGNQGRFYSDFTRLTACQKPRIRGTVGRRDLPDWNQVVYGLPPLLLRAAGLAAARGYAAAFLGVAIIGIAALFLTLQSRVSRGRRTSEGGS